MEKHLPLKNKENSVLFISFLDVQCGIRNEQPPMSCDLGCLLIWVVMVHAIDHVRDHVICLMYNNLSAD